MRKGPGGADCTECAAKREEKMIFNDRGEEGKREREEERNEEESGKGRREKRKVSDNETTIK